MRHGQQATLNLCSTDYAARPNCKQFYSFSSSVSFITHGQQATLEHYPTVMTSPTGARPASWQCSPPEATASIHSTLVCALHRSLAPFPRGGGGPAAAVAGLDDGTQRTGLPARPSLSRCRVRAEWRPLPQAGGERRMSRPARPAYRIPRPRPQSHGTAGAAVRGSSDPVARYNERGAPTRAAILPATRPNSPSAQNRCALLAHRGVVALAGAAAPRAKVRGAVALPPAP